VATQTSAPPELDPRDFLAIDMLLSDEERAIRDTVRQFVRERVLAEVGEWFEQGVLPREIYAELAKLGLFGMHLHGYGLPGSSSVAYGLTCLELEAGDAGVRSACSVQGSLAMFAIWRWGSEEQKERWLPAMARFEKIGAFGLTEPEVGSGVARGLTTTARRDGDEWTLDGRKKWIGNAPFADVTVIWARDVEDGQVKGFLVERGTPGVSVETMKDKIALRVVQNGLISLDGARVPESHRLQEAMSFRATADVLRMTRAGVAWQAAGCALGAYELALAYAGRREQFGKPIASFQLI
jgi:glutaryl-CoA dehydrogenase